MLTEDLLNNSVKILSLAQRQFYLDNGFLCLPKLLDMQAVADFRTDGCAHRLVAPCEGIKRSVRSGAHA